MNKVAGIVMLLVVLAMAACDNQPASYNEAEIYVLPESVDAEQDNEVALAPEYEKIHMPLLAWQEAYIALLTSYAQQLSRTSFLLFDIDGNGIPEVTINFEHVYTFRDEGVIALDNTEDVFSKCAGDGLGTMRSISRLWLTADNALVVQHYFAAEVTYQRISISGDRLFIDARGTLGGDQSQYTYLDGVSVSGEKFSQIFEGVELFTEDNIYDAILSWQSADYPAFATALSEFFADAVSAPNPDDFYGYFMPYSTHAVWVDIDGNGTQGVLASRWAQGQHQWPHFEQYLFWFCGGALRQEALEFRRFGISSTGRLVIMDEAGACNISVFTYSLLDFVGGELSFVKTVAMEEYWAFGWMLEDYSDPDYFHILGAEYFLRTYTNGNLWQSRYLMWESSPITYEEFSNLMAQYGFYGATTHVWEFERAFADE